MAIARKSRCTVKRNLLTISIRKKRVYAPEDMEDLREQLVFLAMALAKRQSPRFIAPIMTESALDVTVHAQGVTCGVVLRRYRFRPENCEREIESSQATHPMTWREGLEDLQAYLRRELHKKAKELTARAAACNELAGGMMVNTEALPGLQAS